MEQFKPEAILGNLTPSKPQPNASSSDYVIDRLRMMLSGFRKSDYHNPEGFMLQAAANLSAFPKEIVDYITDPKTGIQARLQWPPSLAEIVEAARAEQAHRDKIARYAAMGPRAPALPKPSMSGVQGDGGPGTIYTAKAFHQAVEKHGRPVGPFEAGREKIYGS